MLSFPNTVINKPLSVPVHSLSYVWIKFTSQLELLQQVGSLISLKAERSISIISIANNTTNKMFQENISPKQGKRRRKNRTLRNTSINETLIRRFLIRNSLKPPITKKLIDETEHTTWFSIKLDFVRKTSVLNPVKSLQYISPRTVISPNNCIRYCCQKICCWTRRPKTIPEISTPIVYTLLKDFTNNIKKTNRAVIFSHRHGPTILNYRDHELPLEYNQDHAT